MNKHSEQFDALCIECQLTHKIYFTIAYEWITLVFTSLIIEARILHADLVTDYIFLIFTLQLLYIIKNEVLYK